MIFAIAVLCFVLGFSAAVIIATKPNKLRKDTFQFWSSLRLVSSDLRTAIEDNCKKEGFLSNNVAHAQSRAHSHLLTREQVESELEPSSWQYLAYSDFKATILSKEVGTKTFPCVYATMGYRAGEHRYVFLESENPAEPRNIRLLAPALQEYLSVAPSLGSNTSLVIVAAPSDQERSVEEYNQTFWEMLRGLRISDPKPWPQSVPQAVESEKWTFCYNGEPVFPVMLTPAHIQRRSRHMSVPLIALQPKWVLDRLLSSPTKRESATGKVRKLLKIFDQIAISPDLTSYGAVGTSEARQLCLLDKNESATCPYKDLDR